ncbi:unnamed protein product [Polarella glacialis]|uniref:Glyceraldehyde 3-phosphate dehydrogenase NAD(P) binding domain-containing protein n=1 Tax=Polarella glacialis TaxID=89957 RepID=A0A813LAA1_POLGL|nr:unnamed protein product [Polarella glacialis]
MARNSASAKMGLAAAGIGACCLLSPGAFVAPTTPSLRASHNAAQLPGVQSEALNSEGQSQGSSWLASGAAGLLLSGVAARALLGSRRAESSVAMRATGIGINGFGRIGRQVARIAMKDPEVELKLVNYGADYVCESTGVFLTTEKIQAHLKAGAKKVVVSAPAKDESHTIVMGVNQETYKPESHPPAPRPQSKRASKKTGPRWTGRKLRHIHPACAKVIPAIKGKLTGMAFRVPTIDVSVVDLTCELEKPTTYPEICAEIQRRANGDMKGYLGYCDESLVSTDFETCAISCTFDSKAGIMLDSTFVKLVAWYDNEWGYSCRVVDLIKHMAKEDAKAR